MYYLYRNRVIEYFCYCYLSDGSEYFFHHCDHSLVVFLHHKNNWSVQLIICPQSVSHAMNSDMHPLSTSACLVEQTRFESVHMFSLLVTGSTLPNLTQHPGGPKTDMQTNKFKDRKKSVTSVCLLVLTFPELFFVSFAFKLSQVPMSADDTSRNCQHPVLKRKDSDKHLSTCRRHCLLYMKIVSDMQS